MAKSITQGQMPYKDFFYAHPPLHIFVLSILIKIFGVNFFIFKSATLLSILIASFFLYKLCLELFQNKINDKNANLASIITIILFLFSFTTLFTATFSVGVELSVMLMMISFYLIFIKKHFIGGIFAGLACLTNFYIFSNKLNSVNLSYIILRKNYGLYEIEQFRQYAQTRCKLTESYGDLVEGELLMYKCRK